MNALLELNSRLELHHVEHVIAACMGGPTDALVLAGGLAVAATLIKQRDAAERERDRLRAQVLTWSEARRLLMQGAAIQQDYASGHYASYEEFAARMDAAAREIAESVA